MLGNFPQTPHAKKLAALFQPVLRLQRMTELKRLTTRYLDIEDRVQLAGELVGGATVVLWLTWRLMQRLLPVLLQSLEREGVDASYAGILHGFAQQTARAGLEAALPVSAGQGSQTWLVVSVDISKTAETVRLIFKGPEYQQALLVLTPKPLRQWLGIVHEAYRRAGWPLAVWPDWVLDTAGPGTLPVMLH